jgi:hypothetical protein
MNMKNAVAMVCLLTTFSALGADLRVLQFAKDKELAAFELINSSTADYKIGQQLTLKSASGETCKFGITKIIPEKSRFFMNTSNCKNDSLLVKNNILSTNAEDSFDLANEDKSSGKKEEAIQEDKSLPTINESWYTYWGLGVAKIKYPSETQEQLDEIKAAGSDHTSLSLDLFGFYWPLESKKTMVGFIINGVSDSYKINGIDLAIRQYTYSFSSMTFFGPNIGSEWFLRGDIGVAKFTAEVTGTSSSISEASNTGLGLLVGGGYAWPIGTETRLLLNANYSYRKVEEDKISTAALTLGVLF